MRFPLRPLALVEAWFDLMPPPQQSGARALHAAVTAAAPGLSVAVKWGNLVYSLDGAHVLAIAPHKAHLHLQVFHGAALAARFGQLEGAGKGMRHLKWRHGQALDLDLVADLVHAAAVAAPAAGSGP